MLTESNLICHFFLQESTKVAKTVGSLSNRITNEKENFPSIVESQGNSNRAKTSRNEAETCLVAQNLDEKK